MDSLSWKHCTCLRVTHNNYDGTRVNLNVSIVNDILTDLVCRDSLCCSIVQVGKTAFDIAREVKSEIDEDVEDDESGYNEEFGK